MANTFADQLLNAGLVDEKKVKQARKAKKKQQKQSFKNRTATPDETRIAAQEALAAKQKHSRALNQAKESKSQARAIAAQIRQLVDKNALGADGDVSFNFNDAGKIKKLYISDKIQAGLIRGSLCIVKLDAAYKIVPLAVADKIAQRDGSLVLLKNDKTITQDEDEYADFKIPDDLIW